MFRFTAAPVLLVAALAVSVACSSSETATPPISTPTDAGEAIDTGYADDVDASTEPPAAACDPLERTGDVKGSTSIKSRTGVKMIVRTPPGYDPSVGSPLIVVYAPAGANALDTEGFTLLSPPAKQRGYVVAYADHIDPTATGAPVNGASVLEAVTKDWCIDPKRVYLTGHSDGGTMCHIIALRSLYAIAAMAPSAAGVNFATGTPPKCPAAPIPEMEIHGTKDTLFPIASGYGKSVAAFWATCDACEPTAGAADANGCVTYGGCGGGSEVRYCEWKGAHPEWPPLDAPILDFFERFRLP